VRCAAFATSGTLADMSTTANHHDRERRGRVTARLDREHIAIIERIAAVERRPVSSVVRNLLEDRLRALEPREERVA
jgi:hypothetical protein